jgi:hypothetical protein
MHDKIYNLNIFDIVDYGLFSENIENWHLMVL